MCCFICMYEIQLSHANVHGMPSNNENESLRTLFYILENSIYEELVNNEYAQHGIELIFTTFNTCEMPFETRKSFSISL